MTDARRKPPHPARRNLRYDRHGDLVVDELDDSCGASAVPAEDRTASRWLANPPRAWGITNR